MPANTFHNNAPDFEPGRVIGQYKILQRLGSGSMGNIYLAHDTRLDRNVALKFLPDLPAVDIASRDCLADEAKMASKLNHPNIVMIYAIENFEGLNFIAMEYVKGKSLRQIIDDGPVPIEETVSIAIQICDGLKAAHESGIIHRDIKPENIIIEKSGRVKICDFGLACIHERMASDEREMSSGSLAYMSPEQVEGQAVDNRSDLFSVGAILYELLSGKRPFEGQYEAALIYAITNQTPVSISKLRPEISPKLENLINRLLSKKREDRSQSAGDVLTDLQTLFQSERSEKADKASKFRISNLWLIPFVLVLSLAAYFVFAPYLAHRKQMLAVLPLANLGPSERIYFSRGITEDITTALAKYGSLGIISNTSVIQYENTKKNARQIGTELGVDFILEGSILWDTTGSPDMVKINCQLIKTKDDTHIWAETYERVLDDIFAVQREIVGQVMLGIFRKLPRLDESSTPLTNNLKAYDYYLQGNFYFHRSWGENDYAVAMRMYTKSLELDPKFLQAYVMLSRLHSAMYMDRYDRSAKRLELSKQAAEKALEIDANSPDAQIAMGLYYYSSMQYPLAMGQFEKVRESRPNDPDLFESIAGVERRQGKFQEAADDYIRAFIREPNSPLLAFDIGLTYGMMRNYAEAERYMDKAITILPDWPLPYIYKSWIYIFRDGDRTRAREVLSDASSKTDLSQTEYYRFYWWLSTIIDDDPNSTLRRISMGADTASCYLFKSRVYGFMRDRPMEISYADSARIYLESKLPDRAEDPSIHSFLGQAYAILGRNDDAIREGEKAVSMLPVTSDAFDGQFLVVNLAEIYMTINRYDDAIANLRLLLSRPGFMSAQYLKVDPLWVPLRNNSEFIKLTGNK